MNITKLPILLTCWLGLVLGAPQANAQQSLSANAQFMVTALTHKQSGKVVQNKEGQVYLSLGSSQGISEGNYFEVVELGAPLEIDGEVIGHEETYIGTVEVKTVRDRVSIASIVEQNKDIQAGHAAYKKTQKFDRFVVAQFDNAGQSNQFTKILQDNTINALVNKGYSVVEREQLERVLEEQKLGYSGLLNVKSAQIIGELLGAQAIIVGTVNDTTNSVNVNARLVGIAAGETVAANVFSLPNTPEIEAMLNSNVSRSGSETAKQKAGRAKNGGGTASVNSIDFEFDKCSQNGNQLECSVFMTNHGKDKIIGIYMENTKNPSSLTDNNGNTYMAKIVGFNACKNYNQYCHAKLLSEVRTRLELSFEVKEKLTVNVQLINVEFHERTEGWSTKDYSAKLRNLPIN